MRIPRSLSSLWSLMAAVLLLGAFPVASRAQAPGVAATNLRLTFHLVEADGFDGVDAAIADVVDELRQIFRFNGYRLLDTSVLTGVVLQDETDVVSQVLVFPDLGALEIEAWISASDAPDTARVHVRLRDTNQDGFVNDRRVESPEIISVTVNVRDGQTAVLGSGRPEGSEGALILVMSADMNP